MNPQVERITYLAGLLSDPQLMDAKLDILRQITARLQPNKPLGLQDEKSLKKLESELKLYLVKEDPLRNFTTETLDQQLYEHFQGERTITFLHWKYRTIWFLAFLLPVILFLAAANMPTEERIVFAAPSIFAVLHWGAAWLFLTNLQTFSSQLKTAYRLVSAGVVVFGLSYVQIQGLRLLDLFDIDPPALSVWLDMGGATLPILPGSILMYLGMRKFSLLVKLKSNVQNKSLITVLTLLAGVGVALLPHTVIDVPEIFFDINQGTMAVMLCIVIASAVLSHRITKVINPLYSRAVRKLFWTFVTAAIAFAASIVLDMLGFEDGILFTLPPLFATAYFSLKAGYEFKRVLR